MTSTPPPVPTTTTGFVVLGDGLPNRPPLCQADDYDAALHLLAGAQAEFYDQLDTNGEAARPPSSRLSPTPADATGTVGPPCYWVIIDGMRPAER